jgi:hypothetical protein
MKINPALFWFLLSVSCMLGFLLAAFLASGALDELRQEKRDLARLLAQAVNHPSSRRLHVVGQRNGSLN